MEDLLNRWKKSLAPKGSARFFQVFPWVWMIAAYCITFAVLALYGRPYIDSDMSSEMILADLLNQEGGWLSTNWWYSTELRVVYLQLFYRIGLIIFPQDWYAARILGQMLCMLALLVAYLYVGHGLKLKGNGVWGAAALACPFGVWYFWYGAFGGAYLPHMILPLLSFGAMLHLLETAPKWRSIVRILLLGSCCLLSGLNSVKGLMSFYLPMVVTSLIAVVFRWHMNPTVRPKLELKIMTIAISSAIISVIGYLVNSIILAKKYTFLNVNNKKWTELSLKVLLEKWAEFFSLFGYPSDWFKKGNISIFSAQGILGAIGLLIAAAILVCMWRLLRNWKLLSGARLLVPILLNVMLVFQGLVVACTGTAQGTLPYQWLTLVPFVFPVLQLEGETEHFECPFAKEAAAISFCCCFIAVSISSTMQFFSQGYRINPHLEQICKWLVDEGYTQGYSSFWNGNVLTEWSNGQIEMWVTDNFNTMKPYKWLQKSSHEEPPKGRFFLLTTKEELERFGLQELYALSDIIYEENDEETISPYGHYLIISYKDFKQMETAIEKVKADQ